MRASSICAPAAKSCGLDYAFIDAGDGPAIFIIMLAGAVVVAAALIVEVKYQPPFWLHAALWLPLIARHHAVAVALDEVAVDRAAVPSQGGAGPADRPRAEMTGVIARRRAVSGFAIFTLVMVAVFTGLGIWQLQRRVEKHALIAILNERLAAAARCAAGTIAVECADAGQRRIPPRQLYRDLRAAAGCDGL